MSLNFNVTADNRDFNRKMQEVRKGIIDSGKTAQQQSVAIQESFNNAANSIKGLAAGALGGAAIAGFGRQIIQVRGEFEKLEVAFETLLQSKEEANALMQQMVTTAATTPFSLQEVAGGAKSLLAYGVAAEDINGTLIKLGDIAAGLSIPIGDLIYLYGTTRAQGRLYTQDLNQFTGRGIPMIKELAEQFGVAESEVKDLVTAGKVGFPEVEKVLNNLTKEGGMFGGLMEAQSKTIAGQISNLGDIIDQMFNEIGEANSGIIKSGISGVSFLVENYEELGKVLLVLISTYGSYKAALITVAAAQKVVASAGSVQAFLSLAKGIRSAKDAMLLFNIATKANPIGLIASAIGLVVTSLIAFSGESEKATKELTEQEKIAAQYEVTLGKETAKIDRLNESMRNSELPMEKRKKALEDIKKIIPEYNGELTKEGTIINDNAKAIDAYVESLKKKIRFQQYEEQLTSLVKQSDTAVERHQQTLQMFNNMLAQVEGSGDMNAINLAKSRITGLEESHKKELDLIDSQMAEIEAKIGEANKTIAETTNTSGGGAVKDTSAQRKKDTEERAEAIKKAEEERLAQEKHNKDLLDQYRTFTEQYAQLKKDFEEDKTSITAAGGTDANIEMREAKYNEDLEVLNQAVLNSVDGFEALANGVANKALDEMIGLLEAARSKLMSKGIIGNKNQIAAINAELGRLNKLKKEATTTDNSRSLKEWQDMESQLRAVSSTFENMGDTIGGVAGESVKAVGSLASSTLSIVSGIMQFTKLSIESTELAAFSAARAIKTVEKASVILAIISVALEVAMKIASLFKGNKEVGIQVAKANEDAQQRLINQQMAYNKLLREEGVIRQQNLIFGEDAYGSAIESITNYSNVRKALDPLVKGNLNTYNEYKAIIDRDRKFFWTEKQRLDREEAEANIGIELQAYKDGLQGFQNIRTVTGYHEERKNNSIWSKKIKVADTETLYEQYGKSLLNENGMVDILKAKSILETSNWEGLEKDKEALEQIISLTEEANSYIESMNDYIGGIFGDMGVGLGDAIVDAFRNGTDAGKAFAQDMTTMLENLAQDFAYNMAFSNILAAQQKKVEKINSNLSLTEEERAKKIQALAMETGKLLAEQQDVYISSLEAMQSGAAKGGYDLFAPDEIEEIEEETQKATSKGLESLTQDQGDELNGRFTALQIIGAETKAELTAFKEQSAKGLTGIGDSVELLTSLASQQLLELQTISTNTAMIRQTNIELREVKNILSTKL